MRSSEARPVRRVELDPGVSVDRGAWWARIPAVAAVLERGLNVPAGVTFLVGENGSGKSTLVEALAMAYGLNPEGGSRNAMHRTRETESPLGAALPGATILELGEHGIRKVAWDDLSVVGHWRRFLDRPDAYLDPLLRDGGQPRGRDYRHHRHPT